MRTTHLLQPLLHFRCHIDSDCLHGTSDIVIAEVREVDLYAEDDRYLRRGGLEAVIQSGAETKAEEVCNRISG